MSKRYARVGIFCLYRHCQFICIPDSVPLCNFAACLMCMLCASRPMWKVSEIESSCILHSESSLFELCWLAGPRWCLQAKDILFLEICVPSSNSNNNPYKDNLAAGFPLNLPSACRSRTGIDECLSNRELTCHIC